MAFTDKNIESVMRHEVYYIPTGDLCVLVQHVQFRIHRYFFERESPYFRHELSKPAQQSALSPSPAGSFLGSSDSISIILDKLTPDEFAQFLWVFYNPEYSIYVADVPAWSIILSLATRWQFAQVHQLCIRELERLPMTDVQRIKLYHTNNVDREVLIPRYAALCERPEPLTVEEGIELGMETFAMIAAGRERVRWNTRLANGAMSPTSPPLTAKAEEVEDVVRGLFRIPPPGALKSEKSSGALAGHKLTDTLKLTAPPTPPQKTAKPETVANPQPATKEPNPTAKPTAKETKPNLTVKPTAPAPAKETKATGKAKGKQETKLQTPQKEKPQPWPVPASENNNNKTGRGKALPTKRKETNESETLPTSAVPSSTTVPVSPPTNAVSTSDPTDNTTTTTTSTTNTTTTTITTTNADPSSTSADSSNSTASNPAVTSDTTTTATTNDPTTTTTTAEPTDSTSDVTQPAPPTSTDLTDASKAVYNKLTSSGTFGVFGSSPFSLPDFSQQTGDTQLDPFSSLGGDNTDKNLEAKKVVDALVDSINAEAGAGAGGVDTSATGPNKTEANEFTDLLTF